MILLTDADITPSGTGGGMTRNETLEIRQFAAKPINSEKDLGPLDGKANYNEIKSRIQLLESELSSVLHSLRSSTDEVAIQMVSTFI